MLASSYTGRQALAEFLRGLGPQRGHWYSIILQPGLFGIDENVARAFPPLSKTSIDRGGNDAGGTVTLWLIAV